MFSFFPPVDKNGDVCISILHEPGEDKYGYEKPEERWLPIHTVETIMISVISMLADPNGDSPANVDAAVSLLVNNWLKMILKHYLTCVSLKCLSFDNHNSKCVWGKKWSYCLVLTLFPPCRKSGGRTDTVRSKGKSPVVYEKAKRLRLSDI